MTKQMKYKKIDALFILRRVQALLKLINLIQTW